MSEPKSWPWPTHVAFQGANGKYLSAQVIGKQVYLKFASTDIDDDAVKNEISIRPDGNIRIKNTSFGKFWRRSSDNWILADSDDTAIDDPDTLFKTVKVSERVAALKNLGNKLFSVIQTNKDKADCLNAVEPHITDKAQLEVIDLGP